MDNFYTYLKWRGDLTFANAPFNEVDNLLLSQIAYVDFDDIVKGPDECYSITIGDAMRKLKKRYDEDSIKNMPKLSREWLETFYAIASSKRFMNQHMSCYVKEIDAVRESQFAAIRIDIDDNSTYIAYSGTDTSVVGWKENFNMTFLEATPGQKKATKYLETVTENLYRIIRVGGHSKGGNLAVYAAMHARSEVRDKITCIYNNDGPGFTKKMILKEAYKEILPRIHTFVPQSSVIGMLLMHEENIEIIKSSNVGLMQHDAVSWGVMGDSFLKVDNREKSMVKIDKTLKKWVEGTSPSLPPSHSARTLIGRASLYFAGE